MALKYHDGRWYGFDSVEGEWMPKSSRRPDVRSHAPRRELHGWAFAAVFVLFAAVFGVVWLWSMGLPVVP